MQADAQFSFNVCFPFGGTSDVVLGEPIEGTGWSPAWNDEPGGGPGKRGQTSELIFVAGLQIPVILFFADG